LLIKPNNLEIAYIIDEAARTIPFPKEFFKFALLLLNKKLNINEPKQELIIFLFS